MEAPTHMREAEYKASAQSKKAQGDRTALIVPRLVSTLVRNNVRYLMGKDAMRELHPVGSGTNTRNAPSVFR